MWPVPGRSLRTQEPASERLDGERLASFREDGSTPVAVLGYVASHYVEVEALQPASDLAYAAFADLAVVDRADRGDLGPCAAENQLVADV